MRDSDESWPVFVLLAVGFFLRSLHLPPKPSTSVGPVPTGRAFRKVERCGGLCETQPGEITELDEVGLQRVFRRKLVQGLVQHDQVFAEFGAGCSIRIELPASHRAAMSRGSLLPRLIDQNAAHSLRRGSEEVAAVVPLVPAGCADQPEVSFVDQSGRLKSVARRLGSQPGGSEAA